MGVPSDSSWPEIEALNSLCRCDGCFLSLLHDLEAFFEQRLHLDAPARREHFELAMKLSGYSETEKFVTALFKFTSFHDC